MHEQPVPARARPCTQPAAERDDGSDGSVLFKAWFVDFNPVGAKVEAAARLAAVPVAQTPQHRSRCILTCALKNAKAGHRVIMGDFEHLPG